jgi:predicted transcriptional regulator
MAKLSISVPDELIDDLRELATGNISAFVALAIRHEVDRRRLLGFLDELDEELGPVDEGEVTTFARIFTELGTEPGPDAPPERHRRSRSAS